MLTAKERYEDFVKNGLTPFFKSKGFKKKGTKYIFYGRELAYVFFPFRGKYNSKDYVDFSIRLEIHNGDFENKKDLSAYLFPLVAAGISNLMKTTKSEYDTLKTGEEDAREKDQKMKEYFLTALENEVFPYVFKFKIVQDVIYLLETTPEKERFWYGAVFIDRIPLLYWLLGQKEKAVHFINNFIEEIDIRVKSVRFRKETIKDFLEMKKRILEGPDRYVRENEASVV